MPLVLVVDDEPDVRELIRACLEMDGFEVETAADGPDGLDQLSRHYPDVVVLDVMMPGVDGWQVLTAIKSTDGDLGTTPVIMLTAKTGDMDRIRGGIEGAIHYITKPFVPDVLVAEVRAALDGEPEPVKRRAAQQQALEHLARLERTEGGGAPPAPVGARPRLSRLERSPAPGTTTQLSPATSAPAMDAALATLSPKQAELLAAVAGSATVTDAAFRLGVSRSNVYASLRRIARKLDVRSVEDLVVMARDGELTRPPAG